MRLVFYVYDAALSLAFETGEVFVEFLRPLFIHGLLVGCFLFRCGAVNEKTVADFVGSREARVNEEGRRCKLLVCWIRHGMGDFE